MTRSTGSLTFLVESCSMKKIVFFAAALLAIAGCQKNEILENVSEQKLITHTFTVDSEDAQVKSFFDPSSESVKLDKKESIAVAWAPVDATTGEWKINGFVEAKREGNTFTYSHDQVETAKAYNYYFVMPYRGTSNISKNSTGKSVYVKLDPIQHPTATSFDPLQDYVLGQSVLNVTGGQTSLSSSDLKLKRLFALVRVTLRDGENVFNGDKLKSVSIGFPWTSQDNKDKKNNLVSLVYLKYEGEFATSGPSGYADVYNSDKGKYNDTQVSPTVTAEYAEGLPAVSTENGNTYTVWYVTLPVEKAQGTTLTVTAQSATNKVTREISLPKEMKLTEGIINDIAINITGDRYIAENLVDENDYWSIYNAGQDIVAGGITINKSKYPEGKLLSGDQVTKTNLEKGGLIFVDGDFTATGHLKLANGSIMIGRKKDVQTQITISAGNSIYLDKGNIVLKNLNITNAEGTANRLFVASGDSGTKTSDYAIIEDCTITARKNVFGFASATPAYVIKSVSFDNCIIKMAGTDGNYSVMNINKYDTEKEKSTLYSSIEQLAIKNCVIYAEKTYSNATSAISRRHLMDLGNGFKANTGYDIPLDNAAVIITGNTLYNINTNGNVIARAYYVGSAEISGNIVYIDVSELGTAFAKTYMFGLYNNNGGNNGTYNIKSNYSYVYHADDKVDISQANAWTYSQSGYSPTYSTSSNKNQYGTEQNKPFSLTDMSKGYFPVNTANTNGVTGASYETKPWVK